MATTAHVTEVLNEAMDAVMTVTNTQITRDNPSLVSYSVMQSGIGVLVGITGDVLGRIVLDGKLDTFSSVAQSMYGMTLQGDLLESFVGEFGNMIVGTTATNLSNHGVLVEITPPTVIAGPTKLSGFQRGISVAVHLHGMGTVRLVLIIEKLNHVERGAINGTSDDYG